MQHARRKIWYNTRLNMSGEMHMWRWMDAKVRYSAAYPTGRERFCRQDMLTVDMSSAAIFFRMGWEENVTPACADICWLVNDGAK